MSDFKLAEAVRKLLGFYHPVKLKENLAELWEGWLTNDDTDTANSFERSDKLMTFKTLSKFLDEIRET